MNESKFAALLRFLFGEDRKKLTVPPAKVKKILSGIWKKAENPVQEEKGKDK